jgi:hypothetical protein
MQLKLLGKFSIKLEGLMQKKRISLDQFLHTKVPVVFSLILALTLFISCASPESPEEENDTYFFSGTVTDVTTGLPIADVNIKVMNPAFSKQTTTDNNGLYSITYTGSGLYVHGPATIWGRYSQSVMLEADSPDYEIVTENFPNTPGAYTINFQLKPYSY